MRFQRDPDTCGRGLSQTHFVTAISFELYGESHRPKAVDKARPCIVLHKATGNQREACE